MFLDKADEMANAVLPAFDTPTGIPYAIIDLKTYVFALRLGDTYVRALCLPSDNSIKGIDRFALAGKGRKITDGPLDPVRSCRRLAVSIWSLHIYRR